MADNDNKLGLSRESTGAPTALRNPNDHDTKVVPFPAGHRKPVERPHRVLFDLDDFDPGPGAA